MQKHQVNGITKKDYSDQKNKGSEKSQTSRNVYGGDETE